MGTKLSHNDVQPTNKRTKIRFRIDYFFDLAVEEITIDIGIPALLSRNL